MYEKNSLSANCVSYFFLRKIHMFSETKCDLSCTKYGSCKTPAVSHPTQQSELLKWKRSLQLWSNFKAVTNIKPCRKKVWGFNWIRTGREPLDFFSGLNCNCFRLLHNCRDLFHLYSLSTAHSYDLYHISFQSKPWQLKKINSLLWALEWRVLHRQLRDEVFL